MRYHKCGWCGSSDPDKNCVSSQHPRRKRIASRKRQHVWVAMAHPVGVSSDSQVYSVTGVFKTCKAAKLATQSGWHADVLANVAWTCNARRNRWIATWNTRTIGKVYKHVVMS